MEVHEEGTLIISIVQIPKPKEQLTMFYNLSFDLPDYKRQNSCISYFILLLVLYDMISPLKI